MHRTLRTLIVLIIGTISCQHFSHVSITSLSKRIDPVELQFNHDAVIIAGTLGCHLNFNTKGNENIMRSCEVDQKRLGFQPIGKEEQRDRIINSLASLFWQFPMQLI